MSNNSSTWASATSQKKNAQHFAGMQEHFCDYISDNVLLTILSALEAVATKNISLLTTDVKTRNLVGVSRETIEDALTSLNIDASVLTKQSNAMLDILLASEEVAK